MLTNQQKWPMNKKLPDQKNLTTKKISWPNKKNNQLNQNTQPKKLTNKQKLAQAKKWSNQTSQMSQWLNQSKKDPQKKTFQYIKDTGSPLLHWTIGFDLRNYKSFSHFLLPAFPIHTDRFPKNVLSLTQFLQIYDSIDKDVVKGNFSLIWEIFATLGWEPLSFMSFLVVKVLTKLAMFYNWWDGASKMRKRRSDVFIRRNLN